MRKKSLECFLDDLQRCEALGLELYNLQYASFTILFDFGSLFFSVDADSESLGSTGTSLRNAPIESYITSIADCINWAHKATRTVTIVLRSKVQACRFSLAAQG